MAIPFLVCLLSVASPKAEVAVVCPNVFRAELAPWVEHRTRQGHTITWLEPSTPAEIRGRLQALAKQRGLRFVVLVGDIPRAGVPASPTDPGVPTFLVRAKVNVQWGSEPEIASDNHYADLDDDGSPDVAIGRLPVDSPLELRRLVTKILAYESNPDFGMWRRKINFVAGLGGLGFLADAALEAAAKKLITDGVPAGYETSMTYGSWRSPYCPDPREFRQATLDRLNEGCLFWVYIGHGHRQQCDIMRVPGGVFPIFDTRDVPQLQSVSGSPIACFLACYAGAFDHPQDCLAEEMLRAPGGPVAVYAGSRVTMPYAMAVMGLSMLETCFDREHPSATLGEALQETKRRMLTDEPNNATRTALDGIAKLISPAPANLRAERAEHAYLFNLLGDPLLRLPQPQRVQLEVHGKSTPGQELTIEGTCEIDGEARVEIVVRRDRLTFSPPARTEYEPSSRFLSAFNQIYQHANDARLASVAVPVRNGAFACKLSIPADAHGACHVRTFVEGAGGYAIGSCDLQIMAAEPQAVSSAQRIKPN